MDDPFAWQADLLGEAGQENLRKATVLVSRIGGVGGAVAYGLAAAGVGRLVLAHAGSLRLDDLNRQTLMTHDWIGKPRVESAARRLRELNPQLGVEGVDANLTAENAAALVGKVDLVVSAAPIFAERLVMNVACVKQGKPLVDAAMYGTEIRVMSVLPGKTACLACLYPEEPAGWTRRFPVLGAVAHAAGALGATEAVKLLAGLGEPLAGRMLCGDLRDMSFRTVKLARSPSCIVCG